MPGLALVRKQLDLWFPRLENLGVLLLVVAQHDPHARASGQQNPSSSSSSTTTTTTTVTTSTRLGTAASRAGDTHRPPPVHVLFARAMASSKVVEHASRAMGAMALLDGVTIGTGERQLGGQQAAGGASAAAHHRPAVMVFATFLQLLEFSDHPPRVPPLSSSGGSCGSSGGGDGIGVSRLIHASQPPDPSPLPQPIIGPCSRYVLTCLGLRCLHDLDGGSCYGTHAAGAGARAAALCGPEPRRKE